MSRALWLLVFLAVRARYRRIARGLRTVKGLLLMMVGLFFFAMVMLAPFAAEQTRFDGGQGLPVNTSPLQRFGPAGLLVFILLSLFTSSKYRGIYFSPAEVDFLFPAPFTRRELLLYRLSTLIVHTILSVLFTGLFLYRYLHGFWQTAAGLFLAFTFINLVQIAGSLVSATLEEKLVARGRRFVGLLLLLFAVLVFAASGAALEGGSALRGRVKDFLGSPAVGWALLPLKTFAETLAAPTWESFLLWGGAALAVDLVLFALVLRLDVDFTEASLETSRKLHERIMQLRRGGRMAASGRKLRLTLPFLPRWNGVGVIAWRQAQEMVRDMPGAVYLLVIFGLAVLVSSSIFGDHGEGTTNQMTASATFMVAMLPFIAANWFRFDFRGDLERMDMLLTLPVRPVLLCLGQLLVPALILGVLQAGGFILLRWLGSPPEPPGDWLIRYGPLAAPAFGFLLVAIENLFFLLFPIRVGPAAPGDFQTVGRVLMGMMAKLLVLLVVLMVGGMLAYFTAAWTGVAEAGVAVFLLVLLAADAAAVFAVAMAFTRFDVTRPPAD